MAVNQSNVPYFGRAWLLTIQTSSGQLLIGNTSYDQDGAEIKFTTEAVASRASSWADIEIFNLAPATTQDLLGLTFNGAISQANLVNLFAGYQQNWLSNPQANSAASNDDEVNSSGNLIWTGRVFQPLWDREEVHTYKLTLHCLLGFIESVQNFTNINAGPFVAQGDVVRRMAAQSYNSFSTFGDGTGIDDISDLDAIGNSGALPRGQVLSGRVNDIIEEIARHNNLVYWITPKGVTIRSLLPSGTQASDLIYGPRIPDGANITVPANYTPTLIGTPQQTQEGVTFQVAMDSRVKIGAVVELDFSVIRQIPAYQGQIPSVLDTNGQYVVARVRHVGNTRLEDWYTEITGVGLNFWSQYITSLQTANTN